MTIKVTSVREADGGGAVLVGLDISSAEAGQSEKRAWLLTLSDYRAHRLRRGDEITPEVFDELEELSKKAEAMRRGAGILAYGANSKETLKRKLIIKGHSRDAAEAAVAELASEGLIDEKNAALREAERCVAQCRGRKYIAARLYSLGYRGDAADAANDYLDEVDFSELCARVIAKKYGGELPHDAHERERATAALLRRGFSMSDIRAASRAARH